MYNAVSTVNPTAELPLRSLVGDYLKKSPPKGIVRISSGIFIHARINERSSVNVSLALLANFQIPLTKIMGTPSNFWTTAGFEATADRKPEHGFPGVSRDSTTMVPSYPLERVVDRLTGPSPVFSDSSMSSGSLTPPVHLYASTRRNSPATRRRATSLPIAVPCTSGEKSLQDLEARQQADRQAATSMYFEAKTKSMASKLVKAGISCGTVQSLEESSHSEEQSRTSKRYPRNSLLRRDTSMENMGVFKLEDTN